MTPCLARPVGSSHVSRRCSSNPALGCQTSESSFYPDQSQPPSSFLQIIGDPSPEAVSSRRIRYRFLKSTEEYSSTWPYELQGPDMLPVGFPSTSAGHWFWDLPNSGALMCVYIYICTRRLAGHAGMCMYIYIYMYTYTCIQILIHLEREIDRSMISWQFQILVLVVCLDSRGESTRLNVSLDCGAKKRSRVLRPCRDPPWCYLCC